VRRGLPSLTLRGRGLGSLYELDAEPSAEDAAILRSLMNAGTSDRVEFLGGSR
jgi:hypothetical protein